MQVSQTSGLICTPALSSHYGMFQEVEKEIEEEASGKKRRKRTVRQMEYCYEADLEGAAWLIL